ncbi:MAG: FKBP-type peptidyl-prolyl cis-trans isomerase [Alphaproteobacteria bacterium]|nr:FKBP-type peptidyl-prolyl cis-trans isomerase [Alphaproteobacteria bacterium]
MKKLATVLGVVGSLSLVACDSHAGAKNGDTVIIDFAGFDGGVQFDGGTAQNYPLTLGSGQFVPGFEEQLIGANVGETRDVNIRFPDNYVPSLAGHQVVFKVTVKEIKSK